MLGTMCDVGFMTTTSVGYQYAECKSLDNKSNLCGNIQALSAVAAFAVEA